MKKNSNMIFGMIVTIVALGLISLLVILSDTESEPTTTTTDEKVNIENQPTLGKTDAPVTIVEFGDFKCPACKAWGEEILPKLLNDYIDNGKVKFSYVNVLFHGEESKLAALAAESVLKRSPDQYWKFHKTLFENQPNNDSEWITLDKLLEISEDISGISTVQLEEDVKSEKENAEVIRDTKLVEKHNINRTPTIVINDTIISDPFDYEQIVTGIENALEEENE